MKVGYKKLGLILGVVVACALLPTRVNAQGAGYSPIFWSLEGSAGLALPMGDLGDVAESGVAFQVAGSYFVSPRFALRAQGGLDLLDTSGTTDANDPDLQIWHFTGGFEYHLTDPSGNAMVVIDAGAGGVTFDTGIFQPPNPTGTTTTAFQHTYLEANGGLKLGYNFARHAATGVPQATLFVQANLHVMFADEEDSRLYAAVAGQQGFGTVLEVPITAGLRLNIP